MPQTQIEVYMSLTWLVVNNHGSQRHAADTDRGIHVADMAARKQSRIAAPCRRSRELWQRKMCYKGKYTLCGSWVLYRPTVLQFTPIFHLVVLPCSWRCASRTTPWRAVWWSYGETSNRWNCSDPTRNIRTYWRRRSTWSTARTYCSTDFPTPSVRRWSIAASPKWISVRGASLSSELWRRPPSCRRVYDYCFVDVHWSVSTMWPRSWMTVIPTSTTKDALCAMGYFQCVNNFAEPTFAVGIFHVGPHIQTLWTRVYSI